MNQSDVLHKLKSLHECKEAFTVTFSGKKSGRVNGIYKPFPREIIIHNLNFEKDGIQNESLLMYTAMHELSHHIQYTEYGFKGTRSHNKLFYSILDDLADKAEAACIYKPVIDAELQGLIKQAQDTSNEIAMLQRDLGKLLEKLNDACIKKGVRMEDVVNRKARISMQTTKKAMKTASLDLPGNITADIQEAIVSERDNDKRKAMTAAAQAGRSVNQIKRAGSSPSSAQNNSGEKEIDNLLQEKERIETQIKNLQQRLKKIIEKINSDNALRISAAERRNL